MATGVECTTKTIKEVRKFICYDLKTNHNKFYDLTVFTDDTWQGKYGRVDVTATFTEVYSNYSKPYEKIAREKIAKGYVPFSGIENTAPSKIVVAPAHTNLKAVAQQIRTNSPIADALIDRLIKANVHAITETTTLKYDVSKGTFSTPLGIITDTGISHARTTLVSISSFVQRGDYGNPNLERLVNTYFQTVPKNFGMKIPSIDQIFPDMTSIQAQNNILDSLQTSLELVLKGDDEDKDEKPKENKVVFDAKIHLVDDPKVIDAINKLYTSTKQSMHSSHTLKIKKVYEIEIGQMTRDFDARGSKVGNVKRLWHGSKVANILSILKSGFQTSPPSTAAIAGKMFGNGTYFSDQSTKALNYSNGYWGGSRDNNCFMFLNDVAMGKEYTPRSYTECSGWNKAKDGYNSTYAKGGYSGVANNEMIVYDVSQIKPCYLVEFGA